MSAKRDLILIVTGGRDYRDITKVFATLDRIHTERGIVHIRHGGARGADTLAAAWATVNEVPCTPYYISKDDWKKLGTAAGPIRNRDMVSAVPKAQGCVAFPGGPGTADCVEVCEKEGIPVMRVAP